MYTYRYPDLPRILNPLSPANHHVKTATTLAATGKKRTGMAGRRRKNGANAGGKAQRHGYTPLHLDAQNGDSKVARDLVDRGADVRAKASNGLSPLHIAAYFGREAVVRILIESRADMNASAAKVPTPLYLAAREGRAAVANLLLDCGADANITPGSAFVPFGFTELNEKGEPVDIWVRQRIHVDPRSAQGSTPLHAAAVCGRQDVIPVLLEHGADIHASRDDGTTPLHLAVYFEHIVVVRQLIGGGADLNLRRVDDGTTPIHAAAQNGNVRILRLLVNHGIDINAQGSNGWSALRSVDTSKLQGCWSKGVRR